MYAYSSQEFRRIWEEMDKIEPLTPITTTTTEDNDATTDKFPVRSIWGFFNTKTEEYLSPINSTKQGNPVDIHRTTPYSAMVPDLNPLEIVLYG